MSKTPSRATGVQGPARSLYVSRMFGRIAARYDLMNTLMTLGRDRHWRHLTATLAAPRPGGLALDLGTGSGELALELASSGCRVVAMDFCRPMLEVAWRKVTARQGSRVLLAVGDALRLPFPGGAFDFVTAGFTLRNLADLGQGLKEAYRVLRPGGKLVALELTPPRSRIAGWLHGFYAHRYVPLLGKIVAGDGAAYSYLPSSVDHFPEAEALRQAMLDAGFQQVSYRKLGLGLIAIHLAQKRP